MGNSWVHHWLQNYEKMKSKIFGMPPAEKKLQLAAALSKEGIDFSGGEYTLLAPSNSAIEKHNKEVGTPITADVLKYHVIEGKKTMDALNADQKTLNGGTLTAYRKFRKNWLDN